MRKIIAVAVVTLVCAGVASAADLGQYDTWPDSPLGYFMTNAERTQWQSLANEAAAAEFVHEFIAKRGPNFEKEVMKRATMADQHLSLGKTKGSRMLTGKLIILFGPPVDVQVSDRKGKNRYNSPPAAAAVTNLGVGASARDADGDSTQIGGGQAGALFRDYTFTFSGKNAPGLGRDTFTTTVTVDMGVTKASLKDPKQQADLDAAIEAVALASIK